MVKSDIFINIFYFYPSHIRLKTLLIPCYTVFIAFSDRFQ